MNLRSCPAIAFYDDFKAVVINYNIVLMNNCDAFTAAFGTHK